MTDSKPELSGKLVQVFEAHTPEEAAIVVGHLGSEGIPATTKYETLGNVLSLATGPLGTVYVMVNEVDAKAALDVLSTTYEYDEDDTSFDESDESDDDE
ncbi:hypothetical protein MASR2M15_10160 [Anaerolineales bacterium]